MVDKVADFGATFFGITGGQPFLRKDLFEVLDYATEKGLSTSIITDGRLLDEEAVKKIVKNQTKISVSIDGAEKTNDAIRGKGAYKAVVSAIERFSKEKLVRFTFVNAAKQLHKLKTMRAWQFGKNMMHDGCFHVPTAATICSVTLPHQYSDM
jgi:MoaA/NifB/PqqE/SkfB family radical SAM enzyme